MSAGVVTKLSNSMRISVLGKRKKQLRTNKDKIRILVEYRYRVLCLQPHLPLRQPQRIHISSLQEIIYKDAILAEALNKEGASLGIIEHLEMFARDQIILGHIEVHQRCG